MRRAVVLFNLGGPDGPDAVGPFLSNLFSDPAILPVPSLVRKILSKLIVRRRLPEAMAIYARMGGRSPLLEQTRRQAAALEEMLRLKGADVRCFVAMRYWHPFAEEVVREVQAYAPDEIVLLPLYPQYSTTTTGSFLKEWRRAGGGVGRERAICCYPSLDGLIDAWAAGVVEAVTRIPPEGAANGVRVLFSAHGLPERVVAGGDPYSRQVEMCAAGIWDRAESGLPGAYRADWRVSYQSRATPERWLRPDTVAEVEAAAREGLAVVIAPLSFVSEHSETLVELDEELREIAERNGAPAFERVPTVRDDPRYISGLADLVLDPMPKPRLCPISCGACPTAAS